MDSRFPTHYLNDRRVLRASYPAFRQFVLGTAWSVSNMTDGEIPREDLTLIHSSSPDLAAELVTLGLWRETSVGYRIADFEKHQTSAAQLEAAAENRLERDRVRKQRDRRHDKGDHEMCLPGKCPHAPSRDGMSADSPRKSEGRGKAEAEEEEKGPRVSESVDLETGEIGSTSDSTSISPSSSAPGPSELWPDDPPVTPDGFGSAGDFVSNMQRQLRERRAG